MTKLVKQTILLGSILFFLALFSCWTIYDAYGQEWIVTNQSTIAWDEVTHLSNGDSIPATDLIEYAIYLSSAITDPDKANPVEVGTVNATEYTVTLNIEGQFFVGLKTIRKLANGTIIGKSVIGWSDDPIIVLDGHTFGLQYFLPPAAPKGLRF